MMPRHWLAAVWRDFLSRKNFLVEITQKISAEKTRLGPALRLVHFTRVAMPNFFGVDACWIDLLCQVWFYKKLKIRKSPVPVFSKGQLISEWNFGVFKSPQILDRFLPYEARAEICQKFGWLFGWFKDTKKSFWD